MNDETPLQHHSVPAPPKRSKVPPIMTAVVVSAVILGAVGITAVAGIRSMTSGSQAAQLLTIDARNITDLDVHVSAANFEVRFDSLANSSGEATLETTKGGRSWTLERKGDALVVDTKQESFNFGWSLAGRVVDQRVVLTLPESLRTDLIDADLELSAGSIRAAGDFGQLDLDVSAGSMRIDGSARSVKTSVSAGEAEITLTDVAEFEFEISAGDLTISLSGEAPQLVRGSVSAGAALVTLPDAGYNVSADASAGEIINGLQTANGSPRVVEVEVSAGKITLQPTT